MNCYSFSSRNWKSKIKTLFGVMSLFCFIFLSPGVAAALQTAFIRANDGRLYEVTYDKSLNAKNFSIRLNGEILRGNTVGNRNTIADLYIAASILNILPFEVYNHEPGLKVIYEDTANKRRMERLGKVIVGGSIETAIAVYSGGASLVLSLPLFADMIKTASGAVMEELLLIKAYMVSGTFARMAWVHQQPFANLWASVDGGTEIRIDDIKSSFRRFLKGAQYEQRVVRVMNEYLLLPDQGERAKEFFLDIIPFIDTGRFFNSTGLKMEDLKELERMLAASEREINSKVSTQADTIFGITAKTRAIGKLQRAGRLPNQAPLAVRSFDHQTLTLGGPPVSLDAAEYFRDPEGHPLIYAAWSHNNTIANVKRDGSRITIIPNRLGRTNIIVRVVDSGDRSVLQRIFVTVVRKRWPETNFPDLVVSSISANQTALAPGERFRLDTVIQNQGNAASQRTTLHFYRSSDSDISPNDTRLHEQTVYQIKVGRQITPWKRFTAPDVPGVYYYGVCVDRSGEERAMDNNCSEAIKITVLQPTLPDLVVESISVSKSTLVPGERFTLSATVRNIGTARSKSGVLRYYDKLGVADKRNVRRLSPDQTSDMSVQLEAPEEPGVYYYDACVSKGRDEVNKDNNCSTRIAITVGPSATNHPPIASDTILDHTLRVGGSSVTVDVSGNFRDPDNDSLSYTVRSNNTGVASVNVSGSRVILTPRDAGLATITVIASDGELTAMQRFTVTVQSTTIVQPTTFRVGDVVIVQNASGGGLNGLIVRSGAGTGFAHTISAFNGATGTITDGPESANGFTWWKVRWDRSDQVFCDVNPCVGWVIEFFQGTRVIAKNNTPPVVPSNGIGSPPDLMIESIRVSDDTLTPNESFKFYATVRNQGTGEASRTTLRYYRSSDATISKNDREVDTDSVTSLDPNESSEEWDSLRAPDQAGVYYYGVCVDSVTDESTTTNNCSRGIRIRVAASSPDLVPDLVPESVQVSDATVEVGERFTLYATVRNQGNGDASRTTLRYYRSTDSSISDRDAEEDTDSVTSLDANETSDEKVTITAPDQSGIYYYGVCVDDVTDESNTNNNCSTGIRVTVTDAPVGLEVGDSVVVQNARGGGLNGLVVRAGAGAGAHIISAFNGATGTITDGPESANGFTWWKVRWDRSPQVFCDVNPCVGWVIEFFQGTRVLAEDGLAAPTLNVMIPTETILLSNYPNPFNPETWIPYQLSEPADVSVSIYSVNGHLVCRLDLGHQPAGVYQNRSRAAYWDGRNEFGERVASGLYFYTFTAGDFTATRKMLIRK